MSANHSAAVRAIRSQDGFSLPELLISVTLLLMISAGVTQALLQMTNSQKTVWNRTQMNAGVRSATELLQQEVGQAGRITLPGTATLAAAVPTGAQTVGININAAPSVSGIFVNERLTIDAGANQETVTVTAVNTAANQITATFGIAHATGALVTVMGGFGTGIVPPAPGFTNGSDGSTLKLYGDINGDGNMVYVEYKCVIPNGSLTGNFYRNSMPISATSKPAVTQAQVLLGNIATNPGGTPCFTYQPSPLPVVGGSTYVLDVAITLTVQTQLKDPITNDFQKETKALLNVAPRNVVNVWQLHSAGLTNRIQPMPASVSTLLP